MIKLRTKEVALKSLIQGRMVVISINAFEAWLTPASRLRLGALGLAILAFSCPSSDALADEAARLVAEVHFDVGSADVTIGGQQKIHAAIEAIKKQNPREIRIIGFTDSTGDEAVNLSIARNRADAVAAFLIGSGLNMPMSIVGKGEKGAPYRTPDNVSEPLNRCVGIIAVGGTVKPPTL